MGASNKVTEQVFDAVKFMVKGGASISKISSAMGLSTVTISYIKRANTYEEYRKVLHVVNEKKKERKAGKKTGNATPMIKPEEKRAEEKVEIPQVVDYRITLVANQYMAEQLAKQTELLTLINNKLTLIAEDLGCFKEEKIYDDKKEDAM